MDAEEKRKQIEADLEYKMIQVGPTLMCEKGKHYFYQSGREIKCKTCPIGYYTSPNLKIVDGQLYLNEKNLL